MVLAYLLAALSGLGIATAYVVPWAMVPDIIEFDQLQTGERREGSYYAFASFFQKLATGVAALGDGPGAGADRLPHPDRDQRRCPSSRRPRCRPSASSSGRSRRCC